MKKKYHDALTSERLRKRFSNQFDLVSYAISLATVKIKQIQNRDPYEHVNCANEVLDDIFEGRDLIVEAEPEEGSQEPLDANEQVIDESTTIIEKLEKKNLEKVS